ncbi:MAG: 2-nonaprenyl-3-methyl-6-methoxy,4-benzoquinol hydroxylase [Pseudomonadota bacterium]
MSVFDPFISLLDQSLRTIFAPHHAARPDPALGLGTLALSDTERAESGALMRVNHVGEVCAQALYAAQALATRNPHLREQFVHASAEETDHLAWTEARLKDLGARPSLLNPLWYAGSFAIGYAAGKLGGDGMSLGFVVETERQVGAHLGEHLERLPAADLASRAVVAQMQADEAQHAADAQKAGAAALPKPLGEAMRLAAKVMTSVAHRI